MYVCMYVYIIYIYVCIYVYIYNIYIYIYIYIYTILLSFLIENCFVKFKRFSMTNSVFLSMHFLTVPQLYLFDSFLVFVPSFTILQYPLLRIYCHNILSITLDNQKQVSAAKVLFTTRLILLITKQLVTYTVQC